MWHTIYMVSSSSPGCSHHGGYWFNNICDTLYIWSPLPALDVAIMVVIDFIIYLTRLIYMVSSSSPGCGHHGGYWFHNISDTLYIWSPLNISDTLYIYMVSSSSPGRGYDGGLPGYSGHSCSSQSTQHSTGHHHARANGILWHDTSRSHP